MAINGVGGSGFNPYTTGVVAPRGNAGGVATTPQRSVQNAPDTAVPASIADAIKNDATARTAQVNSTKAPDGVDQDLWSVLTKEERSFFVKAGAMGPLTYGRATQGQPNASVSAPLMRGGRLDIKA